MSWNATKVQISILIFLCSIAFSLRAYATYRDLVFAYDQGRDALTMQRIAHGHLTLIGPVTGLDGVYLGPFWYYLIFPFYLIGGGNPVFPAIEMKLFSVGVVVLLYLWGKKAKLPWYGLLAAALYTFSFSNILFARWLSNPVPLPFFALLGFYVLWHAIESKKLWLFTLAGFIFGCCLQLEAANAIWFIPTVAIIFFVESLNREWRKKLKLFITQAFTLILGFSLTVLPQFLFELKNHFLITRNVIKAFQTTHDISLVQSLPMRFPLLLELYGRGLFVSQSWLFIYCTLLFVIALILFHRTLFASRAWRMSFCWFAIPFISHLLYTGNHGNFWDYYVIAQHGALYLLIALTFGIIVRIAKWREVAIILSTLLIITSVLFNVQKWTEVIKPYPARFSLQEQVDGTNWMINQAKGTPYGVWVYTPSAQDDPYRYIFSWVGKTRQVYPEEHVEQQPIIFLVVEDDQVFWQRESDWVVEHMAFGTLLNRQRFGAITIFELKNTFISAK